MVASAHYSLAFDELGNNHYDFAHDTKVVSVTALAPDRSVWNNVKLVGSHSGMMLTNDLLNLPVIVIFKVILKDRNQITTTVNIQVV